MKYNLRDFHESRVVTKYRIDVLEDTNYVVDEPIEEDY